MPLFDQNGLSLNQVLLQPWQNDITYLRIHCNVSWLGATAHCLKTMKGWKNDRTGRKDVIYRRPWLDLPFKNILYHCFSGSDV